MNNQDSPTGDNGDEGRQRESHAVFEQSEWLQVVLSSVGDGVLTADREGRVTFLNPVAESLTGWTLANAYGRSVEEVFRIVNETTREAVEQPIRKVIEHGTTTGLANHTVLIAKDGTERPIDDSAAPIKDTSGNVLGVVLVFRDITERRRDEERKARGARQAALGAAVGVAFSTKESLGEMLTASTDAIVHYLDAAFARVWTLNEPENVLELQTSSGLYTHLDGPHSRVPVGAYKIGRIAEGREPHLTNDVQHDPRVSDQEWARREGMVAFAGYPLVVQGRLLGVMALFARRPLAEDTLDALASVADVIAIGLDRKQKEADKERAEETLRVQSEALKAADHRKNEFLAMLAHELRNPLAAITSANELSSRAGTEDQRAWSDDVVKRQVGQLARLVDDLLDVSRIAQGKLRLQKEPIELRAILDRAAEVIQPLIDDKGHELTLSQPAGALRLDADPTRLQQVLVNLLTNAAKYTEPGGRIELSARKVRSEIVVIVRDTGVGISPEMLPRIFDMFTQVDTSLDQSRGGLGIGLTLVRRLAELHGGSVSVASDGLGKGSEFTMRLPAAAPPPAESPEPVTRNPEATYPGSGRPGSRVLVVDDNVDTARGMTKLLMLSGHEVQTAHDGPTAIEMAREQRPQAILLDIGLPGMDGYRVAAVLREDECCKEVILIAVSGYGQEEDRRRSQEAGFDHHLIKPVNYDELLRLLNRPNSAPLTEF